MSISALSAASVQAATTPSWLKRGTTGADPSQANGAATAAGISSPASVFDQFSTALQSLLLKMQGSGEGSVAANGSAQPGSTDATQAGAAPADGTMQSVFAKLQGEFAQAISAYSAGAATG